MKIEDILNIENNRLNNINYVYLHKDNNNWYKAYEWSAYLLEFWPRKNSDHVLKPTKKKRGESEVISVSIPYDSISKYTSEMETTNGTNTDMIICISDLSSYNNEINVDNFLNNLSDWKKTVQLTQSQKKGISSKNQDQIYRVYKSSEIEQKILGYQIQSDSKEDLIQFIMELKNMCASRI